VNRTLSSGWTFFAKFLLPGIWIPVFGSAVDSAFRHPESVIYNGVKGAAPPYIGFEFLIAWIVGSAFMFWMCTPLKKVRVVDGALLVSNYVHEWRVPFALISEVSQGGWMFNTVPIIIQLREDVGCGTKLRFLPLARWRLHFWSEDPLVDELSRLAGL
jgi:hypothetical protein